MRTRFADSLVLTYALPPRVLRPLLPPGLELDTYTDAAGTEHGFVAAALGVILFLIIMPISLIQMRVLRTNIEY